ncbi:MULTISPECIES: hypothetical protein [unclassified Streptomyces]|uniref:hypothetical protein n=1 Tax=unclassified Streptomyces TaxID=2593676 RepID=UPI002888A34C|nr:hypothetical protein [Streptomyces sp. DSM 41633]
MNRQHTDVEAFRTGPNLHMPQQTPPVIRDAPSTTAHLDGSDGTSGVEPSFWWVPWLIDTLTGD